MNYWENRQSIEVKGETYFPMSIEVYSKCDGIFGIIDNIKPMEYAPYYKKFVVKTKDNRYFEVEKDDLNNVCEF